MTAEVVSGVALGLGGGLLAVSAALNVWMAWRIRELLSAGEKPPRSRGVLAARACRRMDADTARRMVHPAGEPLPSGDGPVPRLFDPRTRGG